MGSRLDARTVALFGVPAFALAYGVTVTLVTIANNGWYPIGTSTFCGSLGDFRDGPAPAVCLSFIGYWSRAAVHPPYAALAALVGVLGAGTALARRRGLPGQ